MIEDSGQLIAMFVFSSLLGGFLFWGIARVFHIVVRTLERLRSLETENERLAAEWKQMSLECRDARLAADAAIGEARRMNTASHWSCNCSVEDMQAVIRNQNRIIKNLNREIERRKNGTAE